MPHKISLSTPNLAFILSLLQRGLGWSDIEDGDLVKLYGYADEIYVWENGGQAMTDKVVAGLNPFMRYVYDNLMGYMQSYIPTWQEGVEAYKNIPTWQYNAYPRNVYQEFTILEMDCISIDEPRHKNLEVIFPTFALFFYTYGENGITHIKKEY